MAAKRKRVTLNEFKAWLDGVEELQASDWTPTPAQWKLIRAKIANIKDVVLPVVETVMGYQAPMVPPVSMALPVGVSPPPPVGGLPVGPMTDMSPEAKAMLTPTQGNKSVTPNIDTTDGQYQSNFN